MRHYSVRRLVPELNHPSIYAGGSNPDHDVPLRTYALESIYSVQREMD